MKTPIKVRFIVKQGAAEKQAAMQHKDSCCGART